MATGRENLILQGRLYGLAGAAARARAAELLARFDLADVAGRLVKTHSGGTQRRLDVALGLMHRPEVLFLDEPTAGLDPQSRAAMWHEIAGPAGDEGLTVLLTTHYLEEADRLAIVDGGRIVAEGTPDELKGELHGDAVHLELPAGTDPAVARDVLAGLPVVREVQVAGRSVSARSDNGAFLSSAFMPSALMPGWMRSFAACNPLNWAVQAGRSALSAHPDWSGVALRCGGLLGVAVACVAVPVATFRSYHKSV